MKDTIIIGAGPAGISASLYAKRAGLDVLVLYKDNGSLENVREIDNYYGIFNVTGEQLAEQGRKQAKSLGVEIKQEEVVEIEYDYNRKIFTVKADKQYHAKSIVLATGKKRNTLKIQGIKELEGKGVSYCALCDAFFYRNKDIAIIGNGKFALNEINYLKNLVNSIVLLTEGEKLPELRGEIEVIEKRISRLEGKEKLENIVFEDETKRKVDGIFIALGTADASDFAKKMGLNIYNDTIVVDENMKTNMQGVFACGDCTGGLLQISKAVYEGAQAGITVVNYIKNNEEEQK